MLSAKSVIAEGDFHQKSVTSIKHSLDGSLIASAGADKKVLISNHQGEIVHSIESLAGLNDCCWFTENHLLLASDDATVKIYDLTKCKMISTFRTIKAFPYCMDLNRDNNMIVVGDTDGFISYYHVSNKDPVHRFLAHSMTITSIAFNNDFGEILTGSHDGTSRCWVPSLKPICLRTIIPVPKICTPLSSCSYSSNYQYILCSTLDHRHRLYARDYPLDDALDPVHIKQYRGHINKKFTISSKAITVGDQSFILSGSEDGKIHLWDAHTEELSSSIEAHQGATLALSVYEEPSSSSIELISGGVDGKLRYWTLTRKSKTEEEIVPIQQQDEATASTESMELS